MKKICQSLFFTFIISSFLSINVFADQNNSLRDSLLNIYISQGSLKEKVVFAHQSYIDNRNETWITELLYKALDDTNRSNNDSLKLDVLYDLSAYYYMKSDTMNLKSMLEKIKGPSFKNKLYTYYYKVWDQLITIRNIYGQMERNLQDIAEIEKEIQNIDNDQIKIMVQLSKAATLTSAWRKNEAIKIYENIVEMPGANSRNKMYAHKNLIELYLIQDNEKALESAHKYLHYLNIVSSADRERISAYNNHYFDLEMNYCLLYFYMEDAENMLKHLKIAETYNMGNTPFFLKSSINYMKGCYYELIKEYEKSICYMDSSLILSNQRMPKFENGILNRKAMIFLLMNRAEDAAQTLKQSVMRTDSINKAVMANNEQIYQMNHKIKSEILKNERRKLYTGLLFSLIILALLSISTYILIQQIRTRRILEKAERDTRQALENVEADNRLKEKFLQNITQEIKVPLNKMIDLSARLVDTNQLPQEDIIECSDTIKNDSKKLIDLVTNLLDLSRLEAGMMKFNKQKVDVEQICKESSTYIKMKGGCITEDFSEWNEQPKQIEIDPDFLRKTMDTLLQNNNEQDAIKITLRNRDGRVEIFIKNNGLLNPTYQQNISIIHSINHLFLSHFGGEYRHDTNQVWIVL